MKNHEGRRFEDFLNHYGINVSVLAKKAGLGRSTVYRDFGVPLIDGDHKSRYLQGLKSSFLDKINERRMDEVKEKDITDEFVFNFTNVNVMEYQEGEAVKLLREQLAGKDQIISDQQEQIKILLSVVDRLTSHEKGTS